jgi:electron transport complex protein RnfE
MNNKYLERIYNGIIKENPTFILMLGMCPTLATTTSAFNAIGMGLSTTAVLMFSNMVISGLRNIIPNRVRLPGEIVVIASLVTIVQLLMQAYTPAVYEALGIYIPLIVVNCIILGRAEEFANKNTVVDSIFDALGYAAGFALALISVSFFRQVLGTGKLSWAGNSVTIIPEDYAIKLFQRPAGAFIVLGCIVALYSVILRLVNENKEKKAALKAAQEKAVSTAEVK